MAWSPTSRRLLTAVLIDKFGTGCYVVALPLVLAADGRLSLGTIGGLFAVIGAFGVAGGLLGGMLADRVGARRALIGAHLVRAAALLAAVATHAMPALVAAAAVLLLFDRGAAASSQVLIRSQGGDQSLRLQSWSRSVSNAGYVAGGGLSSLLLGLGGVRVTWGLVLLDAVTFAASAGLVATVRSGTLAHRGGPVPSVAWFRDRAMRRYLASVSPVALHASVLAVGLPVFVVRVLHAQPWLVGACSAANALIVIVLQARAARAVEEARDPSLPFLWAGAGTVLAAAVLLVRPGGRWIPLLLVVTLVLTATWSEMIESSASWLVIDRNLPEGRAGEYFGALQMVRGVESALGPAVVLLAIQHPAIAGPALLSVVAIATASGVATIRRWISPPPPAHSGSAGPSSRSRTA